MTHEPRDCLVCGLPVGTYPTRCFACAAALRRAHGSAWYGWRQVASAAAAATHQAALDTRGRHTR